MWFPSLRTARPASSGTRPPSASPLLSCTSTRATDRVHFALARPTPDAHLDTDPVSGFRPADPVAGPHAGKLTTAFPGWMATARAVAIQPDGQIVAGGFAYPAG